MKNQLNEQEINRIWVMYRDGMNVNQIVRKTGYANPTICRHRDKGKWDVRKAKILRKAKTHADNLEAKRVARQLNMAKKLQRVGHKKFFGKKGKLRKSVIRNMTAGDGIRAVVEGVKLEREILGDSGGLDDKVRQIAVVYVNPPEKKARKLVESKVIE